MNKQILSIALLLSAIPAINTFATNTQIKQDDVKEHSVFAAPYTFIIQTTIDEITPPIYIATEWTLFKHDELELVNYDFIISKSMFDRFGTQSWTFKASCPGTYSISFIRNGEIKTLSVRAYKNTMWCGTIIPKRIEF